MFAEDVARDPWTVVPPVLRRLVPTDALDGDAEGVELTGFAGHLPDGGVLRASRLRAVRAPGLTLHRWALRDVELVGCDLAGAHLSAGGLERVSVTDSRLTSAGMEGGSVKDLAVGGVQGDGLALRFAALTRVAFTDCSLRDLDLTGSMLDHVSFTRCDLTGATLREVVVRQAAFTDCTMIGITGATALSGATIGPGELSDLAPSLAFECGLVLREA